MSGLSAALRNSFQPSSSDVNGVMAVNSRGCQQKKRVAVLISGSGMLLFCCFFFAMSKRLNKSMEWKLHFASAALCYKLVRFCPH